MLLRDVPAALPRGLSALLPHGSADRVDANVLIGGYLAASDPDFVRREGITRIVKMTGDDAGYHHHRGVTYFVFPALDAPDYDIRGDAVAAVQAVVAGLGAGEQILVHCHAGVSRSATVVLLYLLAVRGRSLDAALAHLRRVRPVVAPNDGFMSTLRAADASLRRLRRLRGCGYGSGSGSGSGSGPTHIFRIAG